GTWRGGERGEGDRPWPTTPRLRATSAHTSLLRPRGGAAAIDDRALATTASAHRRHGAGERARHVRECAARDSAVDRANARRRLRHGSLLWWFSAQTRKDRAARCKTPTRA